jgi:hypothetical protein
VCVHDVRTDETSKCNHLPATAHNYTRCCCPFHRACDADDQPLQISNQRLVLHFSGVVEQCRRAHASAMSVSARFDDSVPPLALGEEEEAESQDGKEGVSAEDVMDARARCIRLTTKESLVTAQLLVKLLSFFLPST